jgi:hypothetical protein
MGVAVLTGPTSPPVEVGPSSSPGRGLAHLGGRAARGPCAPDGRVQLRGAAQATGLGVGMVAATRHNSTRAASAEP